MEQLKQFDNSTLLSGSWKLIGSGGFGQIYKVKDKVLRMDLAVKLLHYDDGDGSSSSLLKEAKLMCQSNSPCVVRIMGVYCGTPPLGGQGAQQLGLVMEFMEGGSLAYMLEFLDGPPPWPLAFRLAHQVALGMNFLHQLNPPVLHLDLKPSNVLLDNSLNAKLTDFGLAKLLLSVSTETKNNGGGTLPYMPPEAFDLSYNPTSATDVYSYGILLWTIITGKKPYPNAHSCIVRLRVPEGDRPALEDIDETRSEGLRELVDLMKQCWSNKAEERPTFVDSLLVTEKLQEQCKGRVINAVHEVLTQMDSTQNDLNDLCNEYSSMNISSACNVSAERANSGEAPGKEQATHGRPSASTSKSKPKGTQRTISIDPKLAYGAHQTQQGSAQPSICIYGSNVTGLQIGHNNTMYINAGTKSRQRNSTAPSSLSLPRGNQGKFPQ